MTGPFKATNVPYTFFDHLRLRSEAEGTSQSTATKTTRKGIHRRGLPQIVLDAARSFPQTVKQPRVPFCKAWGWRGRRSRSHHHMPARRRRVLPWRRGLMWHGSGSHGFDKASDVYYQIAIGELQKRYG